MANIVKFELTNAGHSKVESLMQSSMRREDLSDVSNLLVVHYISAREGIGDEQYETRLEEFFGGPEKFHTTLEKAEDQGYVSIYRMRRNSFILFYMIFTRCYIIKLKTG